MNVTQGIFTHVERKKMNFYNMMKKIWPCSEIPDIKKTKVGGTTGNPIKNFR